MAELTRGEVIDRLARIMRDSLDPSFQDAPPPAWAEAAAAEIIAYHQPMLRDTILDAHLAAARTDWERALHPVSDATPDLAAAAQAVVEAWDAPSTSIYEHHASVAIAIAALRDATPEGIDTEALARAWVAALYPENEHDAGCLIDDGLGGCPVGAEIAEHAAKVAAEYARQREGERP